MFKKLRLIGLSLGISLVAAVSAVNAFIPSIELELDGQVCYYTGYNEHAYIYTCPDGLIYYIPRSQGGSGGGGGGGGDDGSGGLCHPNDESC